MSLKCGCTTLKGTQCSFNKKDQSNYCGKHVNCDRVWGGQVPVQTQVPVHYSPPKPQAIHSSPPKPQAIYSSPPKPQQIKLSVSGTCIAKLRDGRPCHNPSKFEQYCGVHYKLSDPSFSQEHVPVEQRKVEPAKYRVVKVKPDGRLSARYYFDTYPNTLGDRCNIRQDGIYNCLLVDSAGRPKWFPQSHSGTALQRPCGDFSPRCQDPEYQ